MLGTSSSGRRGAAAALLVLAAACASPLEDGRKEQLRPSRVIRLPSGDFSGLAWLRGELVVAHDGDERIGTELWATSEDGSEFYQVLEPEDARCTLAYYLQPTALSDGRLAFVSSCADTGPEGESIVAYEPRSGVIEPLAPLSTTIGTFTWHPDRGRGFVTTGEGLCDGIALVSPEGVQQTPIWVGRGPQRFRVDEDFRREASSGCRSYGMAAEPAWSPDGESIAFFASPQSVGLDGFTKSLAPWNLYIMDAETLLPRLALEDLLLPGAVSWSPDSQHLAFASDLDADEGALWLFTPSSSRQRIIATTPASATSWSPAGGQIAVLEERMEDAELHYQIAIFDVSGLALR